MFEVYNNATLATIYESNFVNINRQVRQQESALDRLTRPKFSEQFLKNKLRKE